jgi:hypothetical protein
MKIAPVRVLACACFVALTACGGGGGGGDRVDSTPPPPATPSAFPATATQTFETHAVTRDLRGSGNSIGGSTSITMNRQPTVQVNYTAASGSYTVVDNGLSASFDANNRITSGYYDIYSHSIGGIENQLKLLGNIRQGGPQAGVPVQLTYLSFGIWTRRDTATGDVRRSDFIFGYPTASSSMPVTGTASYQTMLTAGMYEGGPGFGNTYSDVEGTATFTANFGSGSVATDLSLTRAGTNQSLGSYSGTGTISLGNQFSGTLASTSPNFTSGNFAGGFFGPSASEMGYVFNISKYNADPYAGATVQPQITAITGTVVGKKN